MDDKLKNKDIALTTLADEKFAKAESDLRKIIIDFLIERTVPSFIAEHAIRDIEKELPEGYWLVDLSQPEHSSESQQQQEQKAP